MVEAEARTDVEARERGTLRIEAEDRARADDLLGAVVQREIGAPQADRPRLVELPLVLPVEPAGDQCERVPRD